MKNITLISFLLLCSTFSFGQLRLNVEGDGTISGALGIGITNPDAELHLVKQNSNVDILLTRTDNFGIGSNGKIWQASNSLNLGYQQLTGEVSSQISFFSTGTVLKSDEILFRPNDACIDNGILDLSITVGRGAEDVGNCIGGETGCATCLEDFIYLFPERITSNGDFKAALGKQTNPWYKIYGDFVFSNFVRIDNDNPSNIPSVIISSDVNKWNLATGNGDFMIGNSVHHLEMAMSTDGGGAGNARIQSDGGTGQLILGSKNNDIMTIQYVDNPGQGLPNGQVRISGGLFVNGTQITSDRRFKKNIQPIKKALETLHKLKGVAYNFKNKEFKNRFFSNGRHLGLIAQDVEKVFPELVKTGKDGYKSINYDGLIPVLIEATKEQQNIIDNQTEIIKKQEETVSTLKEENQTIQQELADLKSVVQEILKHQTVNNEKINSTNAILNKTASLKQNQPNPFNGNTTIEYNLPESVLNAHLRISSIDGKIIQDITLDKRGKGQVNLQKGTLGEGNYFYSLIVDGQVVETLKMVITK